MLPKDDAQRHHTGRCYDHAPCAMYQVCTVLVKEEQAVHGIRSSRIVVGGYGSGAEVARQIAVDLPERLGGLIGLHSPGTTDENRIFLTVRAYCVSGLRSYCEHT